MNDRHATDPAQPAEPAPVGSGSEPRSLALKTAWSTLAGVLTSASGALTVVVVARVLGVEGSGRVAYSVWMASIVGQVALLSLPQAAMRFLAAPKDSPGVARWILRRGLVLMLVGSAVSAWASRASGGDRGLAVATTLLTATSMSSALGQALLSGRQRFRQLALVGGASALLQIAGATAGCLLGGAPGAVFGYALGQAPLIAGLFPLPTELAPPSASVVLRLRLFAAETWIASTASLVAWSRLEFVFLHGLGPRSVGLYATALTISQLATQPTALLGTALLPHFGELVGGAGDRAAVETFRAATRLLGVVALPLCLGLAALAPALTPLLFGPDFAAAALPAAIVTALSAAAGIAPAASALMYAHERTRYNAVIAVCSAGLAAVGFALVIPRFGPAGAAVVRAVVQGLGVTSGFVYLALFLGARPPAARLLRAAIAASAGALGCAAVVLTAPASWGVVLLGVLVMTAAYALAARWLRPLQENDVLHLEPIFARLPAPAGRFARGLARSIAS